MVPRVRCEAPAVSGAQAGRVRLQTRTSQQVGVCGRGLQAWRRALTAKGHWLLCGA